MIKELILYKKIKKCDYKDIIFEGTYKKMPYKIKKKYKKMDADEVNLFLKNLPFPCTQY